jgi:hypothetical protein
MYGYFEVYWKFRCISGKFNKKYEYRLIILLEMELYIEELHNLFSLPNIIGTIKSVTMGWVPHIVSTEEIRKAFVLKAEGTDYF